MRFFDAIVKMILRVGDFFIFLGDALTSSRGLWSRRGSLLRQCEFIGVSSFGIVGVAALFMGAVLGYELYISFQWFGAEGLLGGTVGVSLYRELAPVMAAIMVTGRAGAAMAAELASMRVSEQIDALEVMAVDPMEYLVTPRLVAGIIMMPLLAVFFAYLGSWSACGVATGIMDLSYATYWDQYYAFVDAIEIIHCVTKAAAFGLCFTAIGCFFGYHARGGAKAVGYATRSSVVAGCLTILLTDYVLTSFLPFGIPKLEL